MTVEIFKTALRRCKHLSHQVNVRWDDSEPSDSKDPVLILSGICQVSFLVFEVRIPITPTELVPVTDKQWTISTNSKINWREPLSECFEQQFFSKPNMLAIEPTEVPIQCFGEVLQRLVALGIISVTLTIFPGCGVEFSAQVNESGSLRRFIFENKQPLPDAAKYSNTFLVIGLVNSLAAASAVSLATKLTMMMDADTPLLLEYQIEEPYACILQTRHCHI